MCVSFALCQNTWSFPAFVLFLNLGAVSKTSKENQKDWQSFGEAFAVHSSCKWQTQSLPEHATAVNKDQSGGFRET